MATQGLPVNTNVRRYAGYAFAIVVAAVAIIGGLVSHHGSAVGGGVGWLIAAAVNIFFGLKADVQGEDQSFFSIFEVPWYLFLVDVALIVAGIVVGGLLGGW